MRDTTLVIMAAGIGSRFGGGIKQLEPVGPGGEIIMDYSIFDAIEAGFNKSMTRWQPDLIRLFLSSARILRKISGRSLETALRRLPMWNMHFRS